MRSFHNASTTINWSAFADHAALNHATAINESAPFNFFTNLEKSGAYNGPAAIQHQPEAIHERCQLHCSSTYLTVHDMQEAQHVWYQNVLRSGRVLPRLQALYYQRGLSHRSVPIEVHHEAMEEG